MIVTLTVDSNSFDTAIIIIYLLLFVFPVRLLTVVFIIFFQVIKNDIPVPMLTCPHHLQDGCQASVQSREVWL